MSDVSEVVSGKSLDELMAIQEAAKNEIAIRAEVVYGIGILSLDAFAVVLDKTAG